MKHSDSALRYRTCSSPQSAHLEAAGADLCDKTNSSIVHGIVARAMQGCRSFLTLERHAQMLCERYGYKSDQYLLLHDVLTRLAETDILEADASLLTRHRGLANVKKSPPQIASVAILTADRPWCLSRALTTYAANVRECDQHPVFRIIDDSSQRTSCSQNLEHAARLRKQFGLTVLYTGKEQKLGLAKQLIRQGINPDVINFALLNPVNADFTVGAARNALLLSTIGQVVLSVDDDTSCCLGALADTFPHLAVTSRELATSVSFFPNRQSLPPSSQFHRCSFIDIHAAALGRELSDFTGSFLGLRDVEESPISSSFMRALEQSRGRVLLTQCGTVGDSGVHSPSFYLRSEGNTRSNLLHSNTSYHSAVTTRLVRNVAETYTLTDSPLLMAYSVGLDNREGLVPFFPVFRNEDGLFGIIVRCCFEHSFTCHLPYAVVHDPPNQRTHRVDSIWRDCAEVRVTDIVMACLRGCTFDLSTTTPVSRLRRLGDHLIEIGSLSRDEFWGTIRHLTGLLIASRANRIKRLFENETTAVDCWKEDVRRALLNQSRQLFAPAFPIPADLNRTGHNVQDAVKGLVSKYGRLLRSWPDIVEAAAHIGSTNDTGMVVG